MSGLCFRRLAAATGPRSIWRACWAIRWCGRDRLCGFPKKGGFLAYADSQSHTLLVRELYLLEAWVTTRLRLCKVGWPRQSPFDQAEAGPVQAGTGTGRQGARDLGDGGYRPWSRCDLPGWQETRACTVATKFDATGCQWNSKAGIQPDRRGDALTAPGSMRM